MESKRQVALVDVDSTLFDFSDAMYKLLLKEDKGVEEPKYWEEWDFYIKYGIDNKTFYRAVNSIHKYMRNYKPFPDAKYLLDTLNKLGYYIIIATHRAKKFQPVLEEWLDEYNLYYDEVHCSFDKTVLFPIVDIIIDDSPKTIKLAEESNLDCYCIAYPWNSKVREYIRFNNLTEIARFISVSSIIY